MATRRVTCSVFNRSELAAAIGPPSLYTRLLVGVRYRSDLAAISRVWHTKTTKSVSTPGNSSGAAQYW